MGGRNAEASTAHASRKCGGGHDAGGDSCRKLGDDSCRKLYIRRPRQPRRAPLLDEVREPRAVPRQVPLSSVALQQVRYQEAPRSRSLNVRPRLRVGRENAKRRTSGAFGSGPGRSRTCDLGIKSPANVRAGWVKGLENKTFSSIQCYVSGSNTMPEQRRTTMRRQALAGKTF